MNGGHPPKKANPAVVGTIIGVLVVLLAIAGYAAYRTWSKIAELPQPSPGATTGATPNPGGSGWPPHATPAGDGIIANPKAPASAPVVKLYADYQCPACKRFEDTFGDTLDEMARADQIRLEVHTMTFLDTNLRNDSSRRAANAAACADEAGHYAAYHRALFAAQPANEGDGFPDGQLLGPIAQKAGITDTAGFGACYRERRFASFVTGVDASAAKDGITGTPTLTVNGKQLRMASLTSDPNSLRGEIERLAQ